MRILALLAVLALLVTTSVAGDEGPPKLSDLYEKVAQFEVSVEEIGGLVPLPGTDPTERSFLAVSDEGRRAIDEPVVRDALFRITFRVGEDHTVVPTSTTPIALELGDHVQDLDPAWQQYGGWPADLESCVPIPGREGLYLIGGEKGAEDASDGGANRLYVVRYPAEANDKAELLAYLRLPDQVDDTINDRFEAVVVLPGEKAGTWPLFAFKERTALRDRAPAYWPLLLLETETGFSVGPARSAGLRVLPTLIADPKRLSSQADAYRAPNGAVWVLDRWRREIHLASAKPQGVLQHEESLDYFDLVEDIDGERVVLEPKAPASRHRGYGRHEALCFDSEGWLWLAADRGGGTPSVVTVLVPKED